jgi:hypothetical protein
MNLVQGGRSGRPTLEDENTVAHVADAAVQDDDTGRTIEHDGVMYLTADPDKVYTTQDIMKVYHARNFCPKCSKAPKSSSFGVLKIMDVPVTIAQFYCAMLQELRFDNLFLLELVQHETDTLWFKEVRSSNMQVCVHFTSAYNAGTIYTKGWHASAVCIAVHI